MATFTLSLADNLGMQTGVPYDPGYITFDPSYLGMKDSEQQSTVSARSLSDNLGMNDASLSRLASIMRALSDNLGLHDTEQQASILLRAISDNLGLHDTEQQASILLRAISDNLGLKDSPTLLDVPPGTNIISISDKLGFHDTEQQASINVRALADNLGLSESQVQRALIALRAISENWGLRDSPTLVDIPFGVTVWTRLFSENWGLQDRTIFPKLTFWRPASTEVQDVIPSAPDDQVQ